MIAGCKSPYAENFNPAATDEDYSCQYLFKSAGVCHLFEDVVPVADEDRSFTLSYSVKGDSWVFFHDYVPDLYIHTREKLYSAKNNQLYEHHAGAPGLYYGTAKKPFFIDVVFRADFDLILETVNWVTEFLQNDTDQPFKTLTHIAVWNSHQHTGRVPLDKLLTDKTLQTRRTRGEWSFTDFRNVLATKGTRFLQSLFKDYALDPAQAAPDSAWYRKELLTDSWFCVRFEFDNTAESTVVLHETTVQALKSDR